MMDGSWRLIDLDASTRIGDIAGKKQDNSTAYAPPEMAYLKNDGCVSFKDGHSVAMPSRVLDDFNQESLENSDWQLISHLDDDEGYEPLIAERTFDIWSFGVTLYRALRWNALFEADNIDNMSDDKEKLRLCKWGADGNLTDLAASLHSLRMKLRERDRDSSDFACSDETALRACDLLGWILQREPAKRPQSMRDVLDHAFFNIDGTLRMSDDHRAAALGDVGHLTVALCCDVGDEPLCRTPLHLAAEFMQLDAVEHLLQGAPVRQRDGERHVSDCGAVMHGSMQSTGSTRETIHTDAERLDAACRLPMNSLIDTMEHVDGSDLERCFRICDALCSVIHGNAFLEGINLGCASKRPPVRRHFERLRDEHNKSLRHILFKHSMGHCEPWSLDAGSFVTWLDDKVPSSGKLRTLITTISQPNKTIEPIDGLTVLGKWADCGNHLGDKGKHGKVNDSGAPLT